jgi:hypothetical protein
MENICIAPGILNLAPQRAECSASRCDRRNPDETAIGTNLVGGWLVPREVLDGVEKRQISSPLPEIELLSSSRTLVEGLWKTRK